MRAISAAAASSSGQNSSGHTPATKQSMPSRPRSRISSTITEASLRTFDARHSDFSDSERLFLEVLAEGVADGAHREVSRGPSRSSK